MKEKTAKTWDELIEEFILGYKKWWPRHSKERVQKLLFLVLKRRYEIRNYKFPFTEEETGFFKK